MQAVFTNRKDSFSTWLLVIFVFVMLLTAGYTKYFHLPGAQDHNLERIRILFNANDLQQVAKLELKNRLGVFKAESFETEKMGKHWLLTSPRRLFANHTTIDNLMKVLEDIRIKKVYPNDEINRANFSLDTPNVEITLFNQTGGILQIKIGLINPIDNSTYLLSSDSDAIFHIQSLPSFVEKLNFSDFVDSKISSTMFEDISSIKIYKRDVRQAQLNIRADKDDNWSSTEGRLLDRDSVRDYYESLMSSQTHMILDVTNEEQKEEIAKLLEKPLYQLKVSEKGKGTVTYSVSSLIHSITGVRIEKRKYVLIQGSDKDYPYIFNKDILKNFYKTQYSFKRRKN